MAEKTKLTDDIRAIYDNARKWLTLQVEYCKLTAAEKVSVLASAIVAGAIAMLLGGIMIVLLSLCLVQVFQLFLSPVLAYLCVAGIYLLLIIVVFAFKRQLIGNQVSRFITRLLLDDHVKKEKEDKKK